MALFLLDTFTDSDGVLLENHIGEIGATWAKHPNFSTGEFVIRSNRIYSTQLNPTYYASGVPGGADYYAEIQFKVFSNAGIASVIGRASTSATTFYQARYNQSTGAFELRRQIAGAGTTLGTHTQALNVGQAYTLRLDMSGTTIRMLVDGVERASVTDANIASAGRVGVQASIVVAASTGYHIETATAGTAEPATAYTLSGPSGGDTGVPSSSFTVTLDGTHAGVEITPSDGGGGGTFDPSLVTLDTSTPSAVFTYTPVSDGTFTISSTNDGGLADPAPLTYTSTTPVDLTPGDPGLHFSPYNWLIAAGTAVTNCNNAWLELAFTGRRLRITVDVSELISAAVAANQYPYLAYVIDGGNLVKRQLTAADSQIPLDNNESLSEGDHTFRLWFYSENATNYDYWNTPSYALRISNIQIASGASAIPRFNELTPSYPIRPVVVYGDSITKGKTVSPEAHWGNTLAHAMGWEAGIVGFGSQGWLSLGSGNVPIFTSTWDMYSSGQARSFDTEPYAVIVAQGTNDAGSTLEAIATAVQGWLADFRAACPNALLFLSQPWGQAATNVTERVIPGIAAGLAAYKAAYPSESRMFLIDLGRANSWGLNRVSSAETWLAYDGTHPSDRGSAWYGTLMTREVARAIDSLETSSAAIPSVGSRAVQ